MNNILIIIRGGGDLATGVVVRLFRVGFSVMILEVDHPTVIRLPISFARAVYKDKAIVEGVEAVLIPSWEKTKDTIKQGKIPVLVDPEGYCIEKFSPAVLVDAILAKRNLGTRINQAPLVIGLGPGFTASVDVDRVIETMRGHDLGRVIEKGSAQPNTGVPGNIGGHTVDRVLRAPASGVFHSERKITEKVRAGDVVCSVAGKDVVSKIDGVIRGLIREGNLVHEGLKIGDIDPRGCVEYCSTVSEKSRAIGGSVLEAILGASCFKGEKNSQ